MLKLYIVSLILIVSVVNAELNELCIGLPDFVFISDPRSCSGIIHCLNGVANAGRCPDGFYFNPNGAFCDLPENVDCVDELPSTIPPSTTTQTTPSITIECPVSGSHILPHPRSCSMFVLCFGGEPMELECPAGKHYSESLQTCVDPEIAECDIENIACKGVEDFGLIPSTVDCNEYFICFNSTSIRRNCAPALHFNPVALRCESEQTAGCLITIPPDFEPDCPEDVFFSILPHPYVCTQFFYCINGIHKLQECAPGFFFDSEQLHCDYAENVVC